MSNYAKYIDCDLVNGTGVRCTLFFTGCSHGCEGCHNASAWNPKSGHPITDELIEQIMDDLAYRDGLSLSGGDPFHPRNFDTTLKIIKRVKELYDDKTVWIWTGYDLDDERFKGSDLFLYADIVIDGKYMKDKPTNKAFRGSDNQRMWDLTGSVPFVID